MVVCRNFLLNCMQGIMHGLDYGPIYRVHMYKLITPIISPCLFEPTSIISLYYIELPLIVCVVEK